MQFLLNLAFQLLFLKLRGESDFCSLANALLLKRYKVEKTPSANEQFATSGGATRPSGSAKQHLLALVRAFAIPPPAASCHHVRRQQGATAQWIYKWKESILTTK